MKQLIVLWQRFSNWFGPKMRAVFSFFGWLYLARVSVVGLIVLFGLPMGTRGALRTLAIGAFDLRHLPAAFGIGVLLTIAAWSVFVTGAMVFAYGAARSRFDVLPPPNWIVGAWRYLVGAAVLVNLWTIFAATDYENQWPVMVYIGLGLLTGIIGVAGVEAWNRATSEKWLGGNLYLFPWQSRKVELEEAHFLVYQAVGGIPVEDRIPAADEAIDAKTGANLKGGKLADQSADTHGAHPQSAAPTDDGWDWWLRGYRELSPKGKWQTMPGHLLLLGGGAAFIILFQIFYLLSYDDTSELTALVYLLLLFVTTVLAAGGLAFFLDAYRIPFLTVAIIWLVLASHKEDSDHYYRIWKRKEVAAESRHVLKPSEVLEQAVAADRPVVLVAIAGGGIQSAAWGTRVLTGLEQLIPKARRQGGEDTNLASLAGSIQCISGVSGGSTGAMFFVAGYGKGGLPPPRLKQAGNPTGTTPILNGIVEAAEETSLGQCVWGLTYPDLQRAWLPLFIPNRYRDRANTMERKWAANAVKYMGTQQGLSNLKNTSLADWQEDVFNGIRPATIFNGTLVETGERISFSTAPLCTLYSGQREFTKDGGSSSGTSDPQLYPGADLRVTTAARLSATFPVVSSAARPLLAKDAADPVGMLETKDENLWKLIPGTNGLLHVVDGGYFENTGLGALALWLDNGLRELSYKPNAKWPKKVLIIQIEAFPDEETPTPEKPVPQNASGRGTLFQSGAPFVALYNVRGAGHTASATRLIEFMQQRWKLAGEGENKIAAAAQAAELKLSMAAPNMPRLFSRRCDISLVRFTIPKLAHDPSIRQFWEPAWADAKPDSPPLSWHLRAVEKKEIEDAWKAFCDEVVNLRDRHAQPSALQPSANKAPDDPGAYPIRQVLNFLKPETKPAPSSPNP